jgi:predicted deacylase
MPNPAPYYFPADYHKSQMRFVDFTKHISGVAQSWQVPSRTDDDLFVDSLFLPALERRDRLLVLTSGVHGSESYAGAAVQFMFLSELLPLVDRNTTGVLLVHALNPFGFKHHQRATQNGVNLNRNFSVSGEIFKIRNLASINVQDRLLPKRKVEGLKSTLLEHITAAELDEFAKAVGPGQFESSRYLEYGGRAAEPQTQQLIEQLKQIVPYYKDIVALDLHTGLGHRNRLHLLSEADPRACHPQLLREVLQPEQQSHIYEFTPSDAEGFYAVHGSLPSVFAHLAQATEQRVVALTMEYGTLGHAPEEQMEALNRWLIEHQGQTYGFLTEELATQAKHLNFVRSYPEEKEWKVAVIESGRDLLRSAITSGLAAVARR